MSGQQRFQIVSLGKTLRGRPVAQVVQEAARTFSIAPQQAQKLLLRGWVIRDQLSSKQVLEYRAQLQQVGLKVEVHPAGKFDNQELLAKMQFAAKRRARQEGVAPPAAAEAQQRKPAAAKQAGGGKPRGQEHKPRAQEQLEGLFSGQPSAVRETAAERAQLVLGVALASLVPGLFLILALLCIYAGLRALWNIPQAILAGELGIFTLLGTLLSLGLIAFFALLLPWPFFFSSRRYAAQLESSTIPLRRDQAPGLFLLLKVLSEKTGLPQAQQISVYAGAEVVAESPNLRAQLRRELHLKLGLGAACSLPGGEWLALAARSLGIYHSKLSAAAAWLVLRSARRLQLMQWALENERTPLAPAGSGGVLVRPLHAALAKCGQVLIPLLDKLLDWHRALTGPAARQLEKRADAWAAQIVGSDHFSAFAENWHRLVHVELITAEISREASLVGQRLADTPGAIAWQLRNLDTETRGNIELAMAQQSDPWEPGQAADLDRIAAAEDLELPPLLVQTDFSAQKLFVDFAQLCADTSAAAADSACRAVDNLQLLSVSREVEQSQQVLAEYFNRVLPRRFLPLQLPQSEELRALDLQAAIDWLRGKLVDLRELEQDCDKLRMRGAAIQLGAALLRAQLPVDPHKFHLTGATPAAADESVKDNRVRLEELLQQRRQIFSVFYLRITLVVQRMEGAAQRQGREALARLAGFNALSARIGKLDNYGDLFGLMIDRLHLDKSQRELIGKYLSLAGQELRALGTEIAQSAALRGLDLPQALETRAGGAEFPALPRDRQGMVDLLQAAELKCKNASAVVCESYRVQLAQLLQLCLERERALKVRPLRLVGSV